MDKIKLGIIGLGQRGSGLLNEITQMDDIEIYAVCDSYKDRTEDAFKVIKEKCGNEPVMTQDYRDILKMPEIKAVLISAAWEAHADLAIASMRAGKWTALEVGGAHTTSATAISLWIHTRKQKLRLCSLKTAAMGAES